MYLSRELDPLLGPLPPEISLLSSLKFFQISGYMVTGTLDNLFVNATRLDTLVVSETNMTGSIPNDMPSQNPNLRMLDLNTNSFSGPIPDALGSLSLLENLVLHTNRFSGPLGEATFSETSKLCMCHVVATFCAQLQACVSHTPSFVCSDFGVARQHVEWSSTQRLVCAPQSTSSAS